MPNDCGKLSCALNDDDNNDGVDDAVRVVDVAIVDAAIAVVTIDAPPAKDGVFRLLVFVGFGSVFEVVDLPLTVLTGNCSGYLLSEKLMGVFSAAPPKSGNNFFATSPLEPVLLPKRIDSD